MRPMANKVTSDSPQILSRWCRHKFFAVYRLSVDVALSDNSVDRLLSRSKFDLSASNYAFDIPTIQEAQKAQVLDDKMVSITKAARAAIKSYAAAVSLGADPSKVPPSQAAAAMAEHYLPNVTLFTLGSITTFPTQQFAAAQIENLLGQYNRSGLGADIRLDHSRVDPVSEQSALCWITWKIFPASVETSGKQEKSKDSDTSTKPWSFTDVYGFRLASNLTNGLESGWEFVIADDEFTKLAENWPSFFH
ncbi:hypothetical protein V8F20_012822 [Naviculisporaceae sp. PSN 640]